MCFNVNQETFQTNFPLYSGFLAGGRGGGYIKSNLIHVQCKIEITVYNPTQIKYTLNNWVNRIRQSKGTLIFNIFKNWSTYHCYDFVYKLQYLLSFHRVFSPKMSNSLSQSEAGKSNTKIDFYFLLKNWFLWWMFFPHAAKSLLVLFQSTHAFRSLVPWDSTFLWTQWAHLELFPIKYSNPIIMIFTWH